MQKLMNCGLALAALVVCIWPVRQGHAQGGPLVLAVSEIEYVDTSGEVVDQRADHVRRLREFEASLRTDLVASGKIRSVILDCPPNACSVGDIDAAQLVGKARAAGAAFLVIGSVHKMSTLVLWARFDIIDVNAQKVVCDRLFSFRGDNDEAWRRAKSFVVREIIDREAMLTRNAESALPRSP